MGQRSLLYDKLKPPLPPGQMKRCQRRRKGEPKRYFCSYDFVFVLFLYFSFAFVSLFAYFDLFPYEGCMAGMRGEYGD